MRRAGRAGRAGRARRLIAGALAAGALLTATAGCAQSVDPIERLGRKAARNMTHPRPKPAAGPRAHPGDRPPPGPGADPGAPAACPRPPEPRHSPPSPPPRHGWPERPGPYVGTGAGTGCARR